MAIFPGGLRLSQDLFSRLQDILLSTPHINEVASAEAFKALPFAALLSIREYLVTTRLKNRFVVEKAQLLTRHRQGESLLDIARTVDLERNRHSLCRLTVPPCFLCRKLLPELLGIPRKDVTSVLRQPASVGDTRLAGEVQQCVEADDLCSPAADRARRQLGDTYERLLHNKLRQLEIPFNTEDDLKVEGRPKTPDAHLLCPVLVQGKLVHWIDSKALFGMDSSLYEQQFRSYVNRYGPGMAIFWFGYAESGFQTYDGVFIATEFPTCVETLDALLDRQAPPPQTTDESAGRR